MLLVVSMGFIYAWARPDMLTPMDNAMASLLNMASWGGAEVEVFRASRVIVGGCSGLVGNM